jgi:transcriptional regulator of acetoin/glycerol metabolism
MQSPQHHIETVMNVVAAGQLPVFDGATSLIHRSWYRCFNEYGLDPRSAFGGANIESSQQLRVRREQRGQYLQVARAGMEQLYRHVADLGYVLMLADSEGVTLDCIGEPASDSPLAASLALGANWNETLAGTNGIGTCLAERRTLTCHREDHYYTGNLGLSCTATPLYDPHGQLLGVLDVSALTSPEARDSQHLARHLTALYGRLIEDANFVQQFRDRWILRLGYAGALLDVHAELMLAFDADGVIVGANSGARRQLKQVIASGVITGVENELVGNSLSAVFRNRIADIWRIARSQDASAPAQLDTWSGSCYSAVISAPRGNSVTRAASTATVHNAPPKLNALAGDDVRMTQLLAQAQRLASKPINMLIQGETGTGKEVLAKAIHESSQRVDKPFVAVNCAAIPESLIESELFGYMPGTFTGARSRGMIGMIQRSSGGTLFLDEIGDMPLALQTRLLRVLSEKEVQPLGADKPVAIDLHVIAASHRDLKQMIAAGEFREDLYYRLCGATLKLPPLRERQDRVHLIRTLLNEEAIALDASGIIEHDALEALVQYDWPGNIRQLRQVLRFLLSVTEEDGIRLEHLPEEIVEGLALTAASRPALTAMMPVVAPLAPMGFNDNAPPRDASRLVETLRRHHWNITEVSRELDLCRATIYRRMKRYGIVPPTHLH